MRGLRHQSNLSFASQTRQKQLTNMKTSIVFVTLATIFIISASCMPLEAEEGQELLVRQKRVTCDLLSAEAKGIKLNHAACAAHCLVLGKRGGSCTGGGVCVCRN